MKFSIRDLLLVTVIARVAVMRRLTVVFWHMLSKQQPYNIAASAVGPQRRTKSTPENV